MKKIYPFQWPTCIVCMCVCGRSLWCLKAIQFFSSILAYCLFLGTTSSSNTVVAGQELFPDTDDGKTLKENEERYIISHGLSYD